MFERVCLRLLYSKKGESGELFRIDKGIYALKKHTIEIEVVFYNDKGRCGDEKMRENAMDEIRRRISRTFGNRTNRLMPRAQGSEKANWLRINTAVTFDRIESFLKTLKLLKL